jgi:hypothetical protein
VKTTNNWKDVKQQCDPSTESGCYKYAATIIAAAVVDAGGELRLGVNSLREALEKAAVQELECDLAPAVGQNPRPGLIKFREGIHGELIITIRT